MEDPERAQIEEMCGSPTDLSTYPPGTLMAMSGVFPSQTQGNKQESCKGSVMIAKLNLKDPSSPLMVRTSYTDVEGIKHTVSDAVTFKECEAGESVFDSLAVRKGVLLSRYVVLLRTYLGDINSMRKTASLTSESGIVFGKKENDSHFGATRVPLDQPPPAQTEYQQVLKKFLDYYRGEEEVLDDTELAVWRSRLLDYISRETKTSTKG